MTPVCVTSVTTCTASFLILPDVSRYTLDKPIAWSLVQNDKQVSSGSTAHVALFVEGLEPDQDYILKTAVGSQSFRTKHCTGRLSASDFGVCETADDNSTSFANAVAAVPIGGTLYVPKGVYLSGPIFLRSDITLYLPEGSQIAAISNRDNWPILPARDENNRVIGTWEGLPEASFASPITAIDCNNLVITGKGIIDGGGDRGDWWQWPKETRNGARRPRTLFLAHCSNVELSGITVRNSPSWTIHPFQCRDLNATCLTIQNPSDSPNTDGFDPESCVNVSMTGIFFSVGDDCIAVKAGKRAPGQCDHLAPTRNLHVHHCLMERGHGAVVLGSEMSGDITDILIENCEFVGTDRGLRIKTRRGRGGQVSRVLLRNVVMDDVLTPIAINAFYFCDFDGRSEVVQSRSPAPVDHTTPHISDIVIEDVTAHNVHLAVAAILGLPEAPVKNVELSRVMASFCESAVADIPLMALDVPAVRHVPIMAKFADIHGDVELTQNIKEAQQC